MKRLFAVPLIAAALVLIFACAALAAFDIPPQPGGRVSDYAGIIAPGELSALEAKLKAIEDKTSNQFVVAVFPSLGGESIEDLSIRIADKWQAGHKGRDNGLLLLAFMEERKVRVEVGKGLEGAIPDILAGRVIREVIAPAFKSGRYGEGLSKAVDVFDAAAKGEFEPLPEKKKSSGNHLPFIIFLVLFFIVAGIRSKGTRVIGHRGGGFMGGPFIGGGGGGRGFGGGFGGFSGGGGSFGGGGSSGGW